VIPPWDGSSFEWRESSVTRLEALAVEFHDLMWSNMGTNDDWPLQLCGDDEAVNELTRLLNEMQREIKAHGYNHIEYNPRLP
jgi:hypothetical protein